MKNFKFIFVVLSLLLTLSLASFGQERYGSIEGTVKDQSGAVIPGATVTATGNAVNRTVTADGDGFYRITQVPPGVYTVKTEKGSFQTATNNNVNVLLGQSAIADFDLKVGSVGVNVTVTGDDAVVDTTSSKITDNLTAKTLETLPHGQGFASALRALAPVRPEVLNGGFQIDGASGSENSFVIDGQEVTNFRTGVLNGNNNVPFTIVSEIQVKTNGFEAEYGGATGGVINVVTKRGADSFHGEIGAAIESSKLFADPNRILASNTTTLRYLTVPKDSFANFYPTASLSGPIIKKHLYFFANTSPQFFPLSRDFRFADGTTQAYRQEVRRDYSFVRLDAILGSKVDINSTYLYNPYRQHGVIPGFITLDGAGTASNAPGVASQFQQGGRIPATNYTVEGNYRPTQNIIVNARYGRSYLNEKVGNYGIPNTTQYTCSVGGSPLNCITGFANFPSNFLTNKDISIRKTYDLSGAFFFNAGGRHAFKAGYQRNALSNDDDEGYVSTGSIDFSLGGTTTDRNGCLRPNPTPVAGCPADPGALGVGGLTLFGTFGKASSANQAFFFQDGWTIARRLTVNAGVRIEKETVPSFRAGAPGITFGWGSKIAPRIGVAFDVLGNGKWKVFGSYGKFYDRFKYELPRGSFGGDTYLLYEFVIVNPNIFSYTRAGLIANNIITTDFRTISNDPRDNRVDPNLKAFSQDEMTVGSEYEVRRGMILGVRFTHKRVLRAIEDIGYHNADGDEEYYIGNPGFGICAAIACGKYPIPGAVAAKAQRDYKALEFRLGKRFTNGLFFDANYTYSRLFGNYSGLASSDEAQRSGGTGRNSPNVNRNFDLPFIGYTAEGGKPDNGRLPTDRPHVFKINYGYAFKWRGSTNVTDLYSFYSIGSGTPVTSRFRIAFVSSQILGHRGDLGRTSRLQQTDFGVRHTYKFGLDKRYGVYAGVEVLNLFDSRTELSRRESLTRLNVPASVFGCTTPDPGTSTVLRCIDRGFFNGAVTVARVNAYAALSSPSGAPNKDQRFNQPQLFQDPRSVRFHFGFTF